MLNGWRVNCRRTRGARTHCGHLGVSVAVIGTCGGRGVDQRPADDTAFIPYNEVFSFLTGSSLAPVSRW